MAAPVSLWSASPAPIWRQTQQALNECDTARCQHFLGSLWQDKTYLHSIQHCLDDTSHSCHILLVLQVDAIQHDLVGPTDEVAQTLVDATVAGSQRRAVGEGGKRLGKVSSGNVKK